MTTTEKTATLDKPEDAGNTSVSPHDFDDPILAETVPSADAPVPAGKDDSGSDTGNGTTAKAEGEQLDHELVARAMSLGVSMVDIRELGDPTSLTKVCDALEERANALDRGSDKNRVNPESAASTARQLNLKLDPDVIGVESVAALKQIQEHYDAQIAALTAKIGTLETTAGASMEAARAERIEAYFSEKSELADVIGEDHPRNRKKVIDEMTILRAGYEATGRKVPPEKELFGKALQSVFGDEQVAAARRKIADQVSNRSRQITARPDKNSTTLSGRAAAIQSVRAMLAAHGAVEDEA